MHNEQAALSAHQREAIARNPIVNAPRLAELTSWDGPWEGLRVVVVGFGVAGDAAADVLLQRGAQVVAIDSTADRAKHDRAEVLANAYEGRFTALFGVEHYAVPEVAGCTPDLVVTSPGIRPDHRVFLDAYERGIQVWGDIELAWRLNKRAGYKSPQWLCLTGTNGKTTTVGMVDSIFKAAGARSIQVGNVGMPALYAVADDEEYDFFAVELSSFQLHWVHSLSPLASVVLNIAEDHVDWHGSFEAYKTDKARIYENTQVACIFNADHADIVGMVEQADVVEGARAIGLSSTEVPAVSMLGMAENIMVDRAFLKNRYNEALELCTLEDLVSASGAVPAQHTVENALAAAALTRAAGIAPQYVRQGLRAYTPGVHRNQLVAAINGVQWVNDSKATNPHAAHASMSSYPSLVWIAGGLSKGVDYDELVKKHADRLRAVLVIGTDTAGLNAALATYAEQVPTFNITASVVVSDDGNLVMREAVAQALELAREGDTVLMAPAAASMDQFKNYVQRGDAFIAAVEEHVTGAKPVGG